MRSKSFGERIADVLIEEGLLLPNQLDEAIPFYEKALKLNPKWQEGWWSLGTSNYELDRYQPAVMERGTEDEVVDLRELLVDAIDEVVFDGCYG